ncbi:hypothetical protein PTKIN_Ptkin16aG0095900 [Pterospermum kingtungense]
MTVKKNKCGDFLPFEIQIEILSRLPATKSLLQFKCVQKSWRNLIEDPTFITMHLNRSGKNSGFLIQRSSSDQDFKEYYVRNKNNNDVDGSNRTELVMPSTKWLFGESKGYIIDSSNGLVCLSNGYSVMDPKHMFGILRQEKSSNFLDVIMKVGTRFYVSVLGFGFSPKLNDYKVITVINSPPTSLSLEYQVYSLSTNSWKKIPHPSWYLIPTLLWKGFFNGDAYWVAR